MSGNKNSKNQVKKLRALYQRTPKRGSRYQPRRIRREYAAALGARSGA